MKWWEHIILGVLLMGIFVGCQKCAEAILSDEPTLADILTSRFKIIMENKQ